MKPPAVLLLIALLAACSAGKLIQAAKNTGDEQLDEGAIAEIEKQLAKVPLPDDLKLLGDIVRTASKSSDKSCDSFVRMVEETLSSSPLGQSRAWREWERKGGDVQYAGQIAPKFSEYLALVKICRLAHPDAKFDSAHGDDNPDDEYDDTGDEYDDYDPDLDDYNSDEDDDDAGEFDADFVYPHDWKPTQVYLVREVAKFVRAIRVPDEVRALGRLLRRKFDGNSFVEIFVAERSGEADFAIFRKSALAKLPKIRGICSRLVGNFENKVNKHKYISLSEFWQLWEHNIELMSRHCSPKVSKILFLTRACKLVVTQ